MCFTQLILSNKKVIKPDSKRKKIHRNKFWWIKKTTNIYEEISISFGKQQEAQNAIVWSSICSAFEDDNHRLKKWLLLAAMHLFLQMDSGNEMMSSRRNCVSVIQRWPRNRIYFAQISPYFSVKKSLAVYFHLSTLLNI